MYMYMYVNKVYVNRVLGVKLKAECNVKVICKAECNVKVYSTCKAGCDVTYM